MKKMGFWPFEPKKKQTEEKTKRIVPAHLAIVMDGNGRWAKERGLARVAGHARGSETFRAIATYCNRIGVKFLTVYAFSTENWKRPAEEVSAIVGLLETYLLEAIEKMAKDHIALRVFGDTSVFSPRIQALIQKTKEISRFIEPTMRVNLCINYGGRDEIVRACRALASKAREGVLSPEDITEQTLQDHLYSFDCPDPDLIIRPGGEYRLSNFLLWQCAYAELYFTPTYWPDFDEAEIDRAMEVFQARNRRFGGLST